MKRNKEIKEFCKSHNISMINKTYYFVINNKKYIISDHKFDTGNIELIVDKENRIMEIWKELFEAPLKKLKEKNDGR